MKFLTTTKRTMILGTLVEGNSVNTTARLCGCSKITVLRLLTDADSKLCVSNLAGLRNGGYATEFISHVADRRLEVLDPVNMIDEAEARIGSRITDYQPSPKELEPS